ncbi:hypothetical protein Palpr_0376 [Paludibacter propionicigenes WB4]|uniref:PKD domain containing protein n=1 Tax=Paludibacter propionicigenes (strain DSM 17365 / JCM 13257 / WB4) TaxID=694427 RepID=E4T1E3_PALPW|nr:T9SS C-terminal target domain-containing protein [Paludibacter propionicigenes]ADQ78537.1 hypothetical protein Palpr_0376 [Paludibacter propionicigenes WB4]
MKKILFLVSFCLTTIAVSASPDITCSSNGVRKIFPGVDYVFIFKDITNPMTEITYNGPFLDKNSITWTKFTSGAFGSSNTGQNIISPEDATGYRLTVDDKKIADIWVIDYRPPVLKSVSVPTAQTSECKTVSLAIDADIPALSYQTPASATSLPITRDFNIAYTTLSWNGTAWTPKDTTITISSPIASPKSVPAPYCSTKFTLIGDQYAKDLGIELTPVSTDYTPIAVVCHETSIVSTRNATNEAERPTTAKQIRGSAPFDMQFLSNANEPITQYYKWEIFKDKAFQPFISRTDKDIRNTFSEAGVYKVAVTVSHGDAKSCMFTDSIMVTVSESQIVAPNVFTPNGDGFNDEFRVAYKSIISFHCWIYNRWGRLVYEWTDPMKGWDGNIGGRKAAPGAYFYIIKALGSDYDPNSKPDSKTKLRVGEYKLKGDINLLRGADN